MNRQAKIEEEPPVKEDPLDFNVSDEEFLEAVIDEGLSSDDESKATKKENRDPVGAKAGTKKFRSGATDTNIMHVNFNIEGSTHG